MKKVVLLLVLLTFMGCSDKPEVSYKVGQCFVNYDGNVYAKIIGLETAPMESGIHYYYADARYPYSVGDKYRPNGNIADPDSFDGFYSRRVDCQTFEWEYNAIPRVQVENMLRDKIDDLTNRISDLEDKLEKRHKEKK